MDCQKLFNDLDSSNNVQLEDAKAKLSEFFALTKESWLVGGLIDYYAQTSSQRVLEVLVRVSQPHDKFIFDKLSDLIRDQRRTNKLTALDIFGFIVRSGPTWLHKVTNHHLLRDILRLLKTERDIVALMTALLIIIFLLPIVPSSVTHLLPELFEVFSHLAAYNDHQRLTEEQLVHLQIGLFSLFQRLYGMYPNSFTEYIRGNYVLSQKEKMSIFHHTIRPLLETVKIHPLLITGSSETERSPMRWKKMEPHDVIFECARLSLEYTDAPVRPDFVSECHSRYYTPIKPDFAAPSVQDLKIFGKMNLVNFVTGDFKDIWSPSNVVLSTPPPTGVLSSTSTPTPNLHSYPGIGSHIVSPPTDGYSPPETAVEATPETTPIKESLRGAHTVLPSSNIARAMWNNKSQPSSPAKQIDHKFSYPESSSTVSQRFVKMVGDRAAASSKTEQPQVMSPAELDASQEDQEVRVINSRPVAIKGAIDKTAGLDDTLTNIDFESEGSPCTEGGLHISNSRSMGELVRKIKRLRLVSIGLDDVSCSTGTTPEGQSVLSSVKFGKLRLRRYGSWPGLNNLPALKYDVSKELNTSNESTSSSSKEDTIKIMQKIRKDLMGDHKAPHHNVASEHKAIQTVPSYHQPYDRMISDLFNEEQHHRTAKEKSGPVLSPAQLLDNLIEAKRQARVGAGDDYQESLNLLKLQLLYERHRREVHADRNRRLMGISRQIHNYEQNLNTLKNQVGVLSTDNAGLTQLLNEARYSFNMAEAGLTQELHMWKQKFQAEQEENCNLSGKIKELQEQLEDAKRAKREKHLELEALQAELFDSKQEQRQMALQIEIGQQYKDELTRLQSEMVAMGEIQLKCRDKFMSIEQLEAKDVKIERLQESYTEEILQLRGTLDMKSAQLETAKVRLSELEAQLTRRDTIFTDLKRDLKKTKDEHQERVAALEKKYTAQKSIVLRMEEHILELYKTRSPVNLVASPESESRTTGDIAGSLEHASSPLSLSQASSDGLSASLKSVTEIRNLQAIALGDAAEGGTASGVRKSSPSDIPSSSRGATGGGAPS